MTENCGAVIDILIQQRKKKGITQSDLAKATELPQSVIARLESKKSTPQLDTLLKVINGLDCHLEIVSTTK